MGIYNEYYEKYYSGIKKQGNSKGYVPQRYSKNKNGKNVSYKGDIKNYFPIYLNVMGKGFANIFIIQAAVVVVLIIGILAAKVYPGGSISKACDKGIAYINQGVFDKGTISMENISEVFTLENASHLFSKENVIQVFNEVKSFVTMEESKEEYIKANYTFPVMIKEGNKVSVEGSRLLVGVVDEVEIKSAYAGKVKSVTSGDNITVLIAHGDGIEIEYGGLSEATVTNGMEVNSNDKIGKSVYELNSEVSIEVFYMGSVLNPGKCFSLETME
ncbi:MAG: M23 family metallopeptidase [Clostridium sp.]|uniref:M23 family metallopeptidase n=1 Tax=Clostridium sp. TaxID=1506 RepID=UPI003067AC20